MKAKKKGIGRKINGRGRVNWDRKGRRKLMKPEERGSWYRYSKVNYFRTSQDENMMLFLPVWRRSLHGPGCPFSSSTSIALPAPIVPMYNASFQHLILGWHEPSKIMTDFCKSQTTHSKAIAQLILKIPPPGVNAGQLLNSCPTSALSNRGGAEL